MLINRFVAKAETLRYAQSDKEIGSSARALRRNKAGYPLKTSMS